MTRLGSRKLHICPKVTKMGSIIGHSLDYDGVETLRGQRQITQQKLTQVNHPGNPSPKPINTNPGNKTCGFKNLRIRADGA